MENAREHLSALLRSLGEKLNLGGLALDERGAASLAIDGETVTLQVPEKGREVYCVTRLGFLPSEAGLWAGVADGRLDRNCFCRGGGPGVLGVNAGEDVIWYCARFPLDAPEYADFEAFLLAVADLAARLRRELAAVPGPAAGAGTGDDTATMLRI
jgi:hypothetical protein